MVSAQGRFVRYAQAGGQELVGRCEEEGEDDEAWIVDGRRPSVRQHAVTGRAHVRQQSATTDQRVRQRTPQQVVRLTHASLSWYSTAAVSL